MTHHILIVDDDHTFCAVTAISLETLGYRVVTETDPRKALGWLHEGDFDVVLLDLVMPDMSGLEVLAAIREHYQVPVLVVSGLGDGEITLQAMRRGATDFASKPLSATLLDLRIRQVLDLELTRRLANTDGLTGLYNHRHLHERLAQEVERAGRYDRPLSLVMADLDHFKAFNDALGHPKGDEMLIAVARTLRQVSRASDVVARYGGEEFTMILPEASTEEATLVAERARQCVSSLRIGDGSPRVTMSLGVASYRRGATKEDLIKSADEALYQAKGKGRNRVAIGGSSSSDQGAISGSESGSPDDPEDLSPCRVVDVAV